ncbi:MAG: aldehyde ferredoxin oxidoreductase family protein [Proteobacteria bacterium]|nr:aldehyde ferredoxin oxidoreductase family protein [Pseudomonadota bacterium]
MKYKLLEIDLEKESFKKKEVPSDYLRDFLGGRGLGVRLFIDYANKKTEPEDLPVFFLTGPLTLSKAPMTGRFHSVFKSPLTNTIFDSSCGGKAGYYLKTQGVDGIVLIGKAKKESIIAIENEEVKFINSSLKNLLISQRVERLKELFGDNISSVLIGPSSEKGVLYGNAVSDRRFFGRGGLGYILARKGVSAITIKLANAKDSIYDENRFSFVKNEIRKWLHGNPITSKGLPDFGTSVLMNLINELKILPHKNFLEDHFDKADIISGESLKSYVKKRRACLSCPVACGRVTDRGEGPEFETLWALGANLGISDIELLIEINELCYEYGVDTISLGGSIACYLEAMNLNFGNDKLIYSLIEKTLRSEDEGKLIAQGSLRLSKELKKPDLSMTVKGLELPAYHPKSIYGMALSYGTSNRGACHLRAYMVAVEVLGIPKLQNRFIKKGKSGLVIYLQNSHSSADSAIFCRFLSLAVGDDYLSRLISAYAGCEISTEEYLKIGERIYNLERYINCLNGFDRKDDLLPQRLIFDGYNDMLDEYYRGRGWDNNGFPKKEKLEELKIKIYH